MKNSIFLMVIISLISVGPVKAQTAQPDTATKNFIIKAAIGGLQEINAGQLAAQKAVSPEVKAFGNRMVTDHTKANAQLMQVIRSKGYQVPPQALTTVPDMMLKDARGKDFDRIYIHMMVPDHRKTVSLFQNYALTGKDPALKVYAGQTLPVLKQHLAAITALDHKMMDQSAK